VYGIIRHIKARLAFHDKQVLADGSIVEMKIWEVPESVPGRAALHLQYAGAAARGFPGGCAPPTR
jgi:hypothetical protein